MTQDTTSIAGYLFSGLSFNLLIAAYVMAGLGLALRWAITVTKAITKTDNKTPTKFSLHHFNLKAKIASIILTIITLFVLFRFSGEIYNMELSMLVAFIGGMSIDTLVSKISLLKLKK
jgi:hypothetical protein